MLLEGWSSTLLSQLAYIPVFIDRLKKKQPNFFQKSIHYKWRNVAGHTDSLEDRNYITPPQESDKCQKDCLEMKECDEERDKDYFMDANLIG